MPWTSVDAKKYKKGLTPEQEKQWAEIANSVLSKCVAKGGTDATCAPSAIRQANGVVGNSIIVQTVSNENYTIRRATHQGKPFIIVPVIMMVEGVHNGSHGPLLHTIEDLGRFPGSWDGIPIVIDHPQDTEGNYVSANSPGIIDTRTVGRTYNTSVDGVRLRSEAWLSENDLRQISPDVFAALERNEIIEVSVGVFTEDERLETNGDWNGEEYNAIARNHRPDHLALLPGGTGACSVEKGCGIRANNNKKGGNTSMDNNVVVTGMEKKRNDLGMSVSEFYAVPRDPPSDSKLPIFDAAHVRNALARFNQTQGLSAEEKATARRKILSKAREFNIDASSLADNMRDEEFQAFRSAKDVGLYTDDLVDYADVGLMERLDALRTKIDSMDTQDSIHFLREVFDSYVVYESKLRVGGVRLYKQNYQIDDGGLVTFTGDPMEVRKKVEYVSANSGVHRKNSNLNLINKEVINMAEQAKPCGQCVEKIVAIINSNKTPYTEEHRPFLLTQSEEFLNGIMPKEEPVVNTEKKDEVQTLSAEDQAALEFGKKMLKEKRQKLIKGIQDNVEKDTWTVAEFNDMSETFLEKVYNSVKVKEEETTSVDWSLNGNSIVDNGKEEIEPLLPTGFVINNKEKEGGK